MRTLDAGPLILHRRCHSADAALSADRLDLLEGSLLESLAVLGERADRARELRLRMQPPSLERDAGHDMLDARLCGSPSRVRCCSGRSASDRAEGLWLVRRVRPADQHRRPSCGPCPNQLLEVRHQAHGSHRRQRAFLSFHRPPNGHEPMTEIDRSTSFRHLRGQLEAARDEHIVRATSCEPDDPALDAHLTAVVQITAALERFQRGQYGLCGRCTIPIGRERLEAIPEALLCVTCQRIPQTLLG